MTKIVTGTVLAALMVFGSSGSLAQDGEAERLRHKERAEAIAQEAADAEVAEAAQEAAQEAARELAAEAARDAGGAAD